MQHTIEHHDDGTQGAFYLEENGRRLAEMTYRRTNATTVLVDHTEVDPSLGGQGVARKLLDAGVSPTAEQAADSAFDLGSLLAK